MSWDKGKYFSKSYLTYFNRATLTEFINMINMRRETQK